MWTGLVCFLLASVTAEIREFGVGPNGFQWSNSGNFSVVGKKLSSNVHYSAEDVYILTDTSQLLEITNQSTQATARGTILGVAAGPTYLHLDAGSFLVTWSNGTEQTLGVQNLRLGAFACTVIPHTLTF